jgi:hypothetical protein
MPDNDPIGFAGIDFLGGATDEVRAWRLNGGDRRPPRDSITKTSDSNGPLSCSTKATVPLGRRPALSASLMRIDQL